MNKDILNRTIAIIAATFIFVGCKDKISEQSNTNVTVLKVLPWDGKPIRKVSFDIEKVLFLETNPNCIVNSVDKIECYGGKYYVLDNQQNKLFSFYDNGESELVIDKKGPGAGEYRRLRDFIIDDRKGTIEIYDDITKSIIRYSLDGTYRETMSVGVQALSFAKTQDLSYVFYMGNCDRCYSDNLLINHNLLFFRDAEGIFTRAAQYPMEGPLDLGSAFPGSGLINGSHDEVLYNQFPSLTIYKVGVDFFSPYLILDFNNEFYPIEDLRSYTHENKGLYRYLMLDGPESGYVYRLYRIFDFGSFVMTIYMRNSQQFVSIIHKESNETVYHVEFSIFQEDCGGIIGSYLSNSADKLVTSINAIDYLETQHYTLNCESEKNINEEDNPVLVYFKINLLTINY